MSPPVVATGRIPAPPLIDSSAQAEAARFGVRAGALALAGVILSGPVALAAVHALGPQPAWTDAPSFAAAYRGVQRLPYALGLLLVLGGVTMVLSLARAREAVRPLHADLARVLASVFAGMILLNYVIQTTFVPALLAEPGSETFVTAFAMTNPSSLAWSLEMWGYAFLGVALWLVAPALDRTPLERATVWLIGANALVSVLGGLLTSARQGWVFTPAGLAGFAAWNALFAVLAFCFLAAWRARLRALAGRTLPTEAAA